MHERAVAKRSIAVRDSEISNVAHSEREKYGILLEKWGSH